MVIDRRLSIIRRNTTTTIIDGMEKDNTVNILAENITISGFTIKKCYKWKDRKCF